MNKPETASGDWEANTRRNTVRLGYWTAAWVVTMAIAVFGSQLVWQDIGWLKLVSILVNLGVGVGMIIANGRHLKGLDEMQRKIQLEAMALSLGVGLIGGLAYSNLDVTNLITFDAEISHLVILMALAYMAGIGAGIRRYR